MKKFNECLDFFNLNKNISLEFVYILVLVIIFSFYTRREFYGNFYHKLSQIYIKIFLFHFLNFKFYLKTLLNFY